MLTVVAYVYAFVFYYFAFQTKKIRRTIGAIVLHFAANLYLSLEIKRTQQFFVLKISNLVKEKVEVEKNEGRLKVQSDEREFSLSIMIPRESGRKNAEGREGQTAKA